jgi:signal transduction histidine kinase/CheY-like chemotaxis protein
MRNALRWPGPWKASTVVRDALPELSSGSPSSPRRVLVLALALTLVVFAADALAPTDIIFSLSYAIPLFLCAGTRDLRLLWCVALLAALLNYAAFVVGVAPTLTLDHVELNRALSTLQILVIAGLLHTVSRQGLRLERAGRVWHAVLQQMPAGVVLAEAPSGIVRLVNDGATWLWRDPRQPDRPAFEKDSVPRGQDGAPSDAPAVLPVTRSMRTGETLTGQEYAVVRADGTPGVVRTFSAPIRGRDGTIVAAVMTFNDITDLKRGEQERQDLLAREHAARAEAEAANRARDEFFADLSHELRGPLSAARLWVNLLRTGKLSGDKAARAVELIESKIELQARLIDDLLDVSRIMFDKLNRDVVTVDLAPVIRSSVDSSRPDAEANGLSLDFVCDRGAMIVRADPTRLQQIVGNLISNAIKFTPGGGRIVVDLHRAGTDAQLSVADTGEGIAADFLPRIFEGFRQAERVRALRHAGLGLGLKIAWHLVALYGGTIRAESEGLGRGARFTVTLPLLTDEAAAATLTERQRAADASPAPTLGAVRLLVVDDDSATREGLAVVLEQYGACVATAGSVAAAIEVLEHEPVDVLLTDIAMPVDDGYALLRRVRALPPQRGGNAPIVAITGYAGSEDRDRLLAAGFAAHLSKPVDTARLVEVVAHLAPRPQLA